MALLEAIDRVSYALDKKKLQRMCIHYCWLLQRSLCWPTKVYYLPSRLSSTCCDSYDIWPLQTRSYNLCTKRWTAFAACTAARDIQALSHHLQSHQQHCTQLHCCHVRAFVNEPGSSTPRFFWLTLATSPANQNWARKMSLRVWGPRSWNDFPIAQRTSTTLTGFKSALKTHLFRCCYLTCWT